MGGGVGVIIFKDYATKTPQQNIFTFNRDGGGKGGEMPLSVSEYDAIRSFGECRNDESLPYFRDYFARPWEGVSGKTPVFPMAFHPNIHTNPIEKNRCPAEMHFWNLHSPQSDVLIYTETSW